MNPRHVLALAFVAAAAAVFFWPESTAHLEDLCRRGLPLACELLVDRSLAKVLGALGLLAAAALAVWHQERLERPRSEEADHGADCD